MIGVSREVGTKTFYVGSLRMNQYRKLIIQTLTQTPSMHQKLTEHGMYCCKQPTPAQNFI